MRVFSRYILVSEDDISMAVHHMLAYHQMLIEGAAALSVACLLKEAHTFRGKTIALIISGKKMTLDTLKEILNAT